MPVVSYRAEIQGQVQGLGFRPHVYRLARTLGVRGFVRNSTRGVTVFVQGRNAQRLLAELRRAPPSLSVITCFRVARTTARSYRGFSIKTSRAAKGAGVDVLPDLATCRDCRREIMDQSDRRHGYAFTNCTQCGPRYTIVERLPYDRPNTTMAGFQMCPTCRHEYADPTDRRYHAQPIACPVCGPRLSVASNATRSPAVEAAVRALLEGRIVALKSLGGYQLACDATSTAAVERLRQRKRRPAKPFALMAESVTAIRRFCRVTTAASDALLSPAAPIVLLPKLSAPAINLATTVAPCNSCLGVMLPYTPLHIILFARLRATLSKPAVLVMTSANRKDDPIAASRESLTRELADVPDMILDHDRPIANRCDDSVVMTASTRSAPLIMVRRARGYVPRPVPLGPQFHVKQPVLAVGGEYKNCFALSSGGRVFLSPHIGTVATKAGEAFWRETLTRYTGWTGIRPQVVVSDLHPDYSSTRLAERLSRELHLPLVRVQHHYAHALAVMAEHDVCDTTLGIVFDGTGLGMDGAIWGGEFLLMTDIVNWRRVGHLGYLRLPHAGDEVADPARVASAYVRQLDTGSGEPAPAKGGWSPTSSVGRLFDAAAALTGVCVKATFDGEAPAALQATVDPAETGDWFEDDMLDLSVSPAKLRPERILQSVARETSAGVPARVVAARFHNTLSRATVRLARELCARNRAKVICLSGGSFQNSLLLQRVVSGLHAHGLRVYWNQAVPLNDGGISYGQVAAAAALASASQE